jgi:hypothetical protein
MPRKRRASRTFGGAKSFQRQVAEWLHSEKSFFVSRDRRYFGWGNRGKLTGLMRDQLWAMGDSELTHPTVRIMLINSAKRKSGV